MLWPVSQSSWFGLSAGLEPHANPPWLTFVIPRLIQKAPNIRKAFFNAAAARSIGGSVPMTHRKKLF